MSHLSVQVSEKEVQQKAFSLAERTSNWYDHNIAVPHIVLQNYSGKILLRQSKRVRLLVDRHNLNWLSILYCTAGRHVWWRLFLTLREEKQKYIFESAGTANFLSSSDNKCENFEIAKSENKKCWFRDLPTEHSTANASQCLFIETCLAIFGLT